MTLAEWSQVGVAAILGAAVAHRAFVWLVGRKRDDSGYARAAGVREGFDRLLEATDRQTDILGKIHDKLIGLDHRTDKSADAVVRVETSLQALHNRLDGTVMTRRV